MVHRCDAMAPHLHLSPQPPSGCGQPQPPAPPGNFEVSRTEPPGSHFFRQRPTVGEVLHFAPSAAPPLGQKTETSVSLGSQLTAPSICTARMWSACKASNSKRSDVKMRGPPVNRRA